MKHRAQHQPRLKTDVIEKDAETDELEKWRYPDTKAMSR